MKGIIKNYSLPIEIQFNTSCISLKGDVFPLLKIAEANFVHSMQDLKLWDFLNSLQFTAVRNTSCSLGSATVQTAS